jgi:hypothetical protein
MHLSDSQDLVFHNCTTFLCKLQREKGKGMSVKSFILDHCNKMYESDGYKVLKMQDLDGHFLFIL